jgi:hypothetical protein
MYIAFMRALTKYLLTKRASTWLLKDMFDCHEGVEEGLQAPLIKKIPLLWERAG